MTFRKALGPIFLGLSLATLMLSGCAHKQKSKINGSDDLSMWADPFATEERLPVCGVRVHFDYDSTVIPDRDRDGLASAARCMKDDRTLNARIEGNADERGTEEYNLALGDKRAHTVAKYLESLGAYESQMKTVSYGEENPVCADHDEACWAKNRRAAVRPRSGVGSFKSDK